MRLTRSDSSKDSRMVTRGFVSLSSLSGETIAAPGMPDGYTLLEPIGKGGWGTVYRGIQHSTGREVAIKILREEVQHYPHVVERFRREARAVSALQHPNIVTLHDFGYTSENRAFMVMELVRGESLDSVIRSHGALPVHMVLLIARQVAQALAAAHDQSIIHRDIKPHNIMVSELNHSAFFVKVLDFGVAKWTGDTTALTAEGKVFGTPEYISPEAARNLPVDARSDLYSLGILLYEMLTGTLPFQADSALALAMMHVQEPPPKFPEGLSIPQELQNLVFSLLAKAPSERPSSAKEVCDTLLEIEHRVHAEQDDTTLVKPMPPPRSRVLLWTLVAILFLALAAGVAEWIYFGFGHVAPKPAAQVVPEPAPPPREVAPPVPSKPAMPRRRPAEGPVRLYLPPGYSPSRK